MNGTVHRRVVRAALLLAVSTACAVVAPAKSADAAKRVGTLTVRVEGLPLGERARVRVEGQGGSRMVSRVGTTKLRGLRPGAYVVRTQTAAMRRRHGGAQPGAKATAVVAKQTVRIRKGATSKVTVSYGTITNPRVRSFSGAVKKVDGPANSPTRVVVAGKPAYKAGDIIVGRAGSPLPGGFLARVTAARQVGSNTALSLRAISVTEAIPNASFDVPLTMQGAGSRQGLSCALAITAGPIPWVHVTNIRVRGAWNTVRVFGAEAKVGVSLTARFDAKDCGPSL